MLLAPLSGCVGTQLEVPGTFLISGRMRYLNVEGGCWYLEAADGKRYEPAGEDLHQLYVEDLYVKLTVRTMKGVASICQVGEPVEVISFTNLSP